LLPDAHAASEISDLAKNLAALPPTASTGNPKTAKSGVLTDLSAIEKLPADRTGMALGAFVQMVAGATAVTGRKKRRAVGIRDDMVAHYKQKREAALGDDEGFASIYNDLRTNIAMGKQEIAALAKEMTGSGARAQDAALKKICNRRQSLVVFKAKSRATAGRSAA
jgi:hypothetical protein